MGGGDTDGVTLGVALIDIDGVNVGVIAGVKLGVTLGVALTPILVLGVTLTPILVLGVRLGVTDGVLVIDGVGDGDGAQTPKDTLNVAVIVVLLYNSHPVVGRGTLL